MRIALVPAAVALGMAVPSLAQVSFNEIRTGSDPTEYIEIKGNPGQSLDGITFLIIGDGTFTGPPPLTKMGVVEWKWTFTKSDVIGPNGYLVLHNPLMSVFSVDPNATNIAWFPPDTPGDATGFEASDNLTFMLVSDYSGTDTFVGRAPNQGAGGQDLDTDDNGSLDVTPWAAIVDSVAVRQAQGATPGTGEDWWYSSTLAGPYISRSVVHSTTGDVIAGWDFQTTTNPNNGTAIVAAPNTPKVFNSNAGVGTMYLDGSNSASDWAQATELNAFTGTAINASASNGLSTSTAAPAALALVNQTANGKAVVFKFSMTSYLGVNVSYATQRTSTGFNSQQWAYSTDGIVWTDVENITSIPTSFGLRTLAQIDALNGAADAYLRLTVTGASSAAGNNRLDNVVLLSNPVTQDTIVTNYGAPNHVFKDANGDWQVGPGGTTDSWDTVGSTNFVVPAVACGAKTSGACDAEHFQAFCADSCCCEFVCSTDAYCCEVRWDAICAAAASACAQECTSTPCTADFNLDGMVDGADLGTLLGSWGLPDYDLTGDGIVDGADLGSLLGEWGSCR